jgi:heme ABC exporter ATP-binding subunit CcmA
LARAGGPLVALAPPSMDPAVRLSVAVALAGRYPALSGVDLQVWPGEIVGVLGANGAGKTSLLRVCAGLLPVTSGEAVVLGCDLRADPVSVRRRVGLLGHAPSLYDELTAGENVRFALRACGCPPANGAAALDRVGISGRAAKTAVGRLSAGQRRRVALSALVARMPDLWLLDEPHTGLDAGARQLLNDILTEVVATGASVLLSSHEHEAADAVSHRIVNMGGGRITEVRTGGRRGALSAIPQGGEHVA